jgi:hypothetical protein
MIRNRAVHELLKYMGGNTILFCQMSHYNSALIRIPSASSVIGYTKMPKRKENFMKELLNFLGESLNESTLDHGKSNAAKNIFSKILRGVQRSSAQQQFIADKRLTKN